MECVLPPWNEGLKQKKQNEVKKLAELIVFYSFNGVTRQLAQELAQQRGAELYEAFFEKEPSMLRAIFLCPAAMAHKRARVRPIEANFDVYDKITLMGPVWASNPAPPVNSMIARLPAGKQVELIMTSASGKSNRKKTIAQVEARGCTVVNYQDCTASNVGVPWPMKDAAEAEPESEEQK